MSEDDVAKLVAEGVIRHAESDLRGARTELETARVHLETAASVARRDPAAAYAIAYDAARKAISAHMRASGFRVGKGHGAHARIGVYAAAALDGHGIGEQLERYDELRRLRNQSEYDALLIDEADVGDALDQASAIVASVERDLCG